MEKFYTCRICHKKFIAKEEEKEVTWHERARGYYYHMECWNKYIDIKNEKNDAQWYDLIFDIITRQCHGTYDFQQIKAQVNKFIAKDGCSMKGIYFTLYWYLVINKHKWESKYGIGIVPCIYKDAILYWAEQEKKKKGIMEEIERNNKIEASKARIVNGRRGRKVQKVEMPD